MRNIIYKELSYKIVGAAIEVHKEFGPGLFESIYEYCLVKELRNRGLKVERQVLLPLIYKGERLSKDFFIDVLVEDKIILELKCVEIILPVHEVQLLSYLKLADKRLGMLLNFNVPVMKQGIIRKVN